MRVRAWCTSILRVKATMRTVWNNNTASPLAKPDTISAVITRSS